MAKSGTTSVSTHRWTKIHPSPLAWLPKKTNPQVPRAHRPMERAHKGTQFCTHLGVSSNPLSDHSHFSDLGIRIHTWQVPKSQRRICSTSAKLCQRPSGFVVLPSEPFGCVIVCNLDPQNKLWFSFKFPFTSTERRVPKKKHKPPILAPFWLSFWKRFWLVKPQKNRNSSQIIWKSVCLNSNLSCLVLIGGDSRRHQEYV